MDDFAWEYVLDHSQLLARLVRDVNEECGVLPTHMQVEKIKAAIEEIGIILAYHEDE